MHHERPVGPLLRARLLPGALAILVLAGCAQPPALAPEAAHVTAAGASGVSAQGVEVEVVADRWRYDPRDLPERVTPVRVRVGGAAERAIAVPEIDVVDTVGAGDTFGGALLAWLVHAGATRTTLAHEATILDAARFAIRASAVVCGREGADPPTLAELGGWEA